MRLPKAVSFQLHYVLRCVFFLHIANVLYYNIYNNILLISPYRREIFLVERFSLTFNPYFEEQQTFL